MNVSRKDSDCFVSVRALYSADHEINTSSGVVHSS